MSRGRGQHAPYVPAAELEKQRLQREELRQLTRELHEAAKDARDARRELRAEMAEIRQILQKTAAEHREDFARQLMEQAEDFARKWMRDLRNSLHKIDGDSAGRLVAMLERTEKLIASLYGWASYEDLIAATADAVQRRLAGRPLLTEDIRRSAAIVTTPDMVDQVRAADPGRVIIDGTLRALPARGCP